MQNKIVIGVAFTVFALNAADFDAGQFDYKQKGAGLGLEQSLNLVSAPYASPQQGDIDSKRRAARVQVVVKPSQKAPYTEEERELFSRTELQKIGEALDKGDLETLLALQINAPNNSSLKEAIVAVLEEKSSTKPTQKSSLFTLVGNFVSKVTGVATGS